MINAAVLVDIIPVFFSSHHFDVEQITKLDCLFLKVSGRVLVFFFDI